MGCYCSDHTLLWDSHCPSYLLLVEVLLDFCSLKAAGISISQVKGISWGYSILVWCLFFFFSVDSKEILLLLGRQNPVLIHLQSLGIEWFIRKTGMARINEYILQLVFSTCNYSHLGFMLRRKHRQTTLLVLRPFMGTVQSLSFSFF